MPNADCSCLRRLPPLIVLPAVPAGQLALQCICGRIWGRDPARPPSRGLECQYCGEPFAREKARICPENACPKSPNTVHLWDEKPVTN